MGFISNILCCASSSVSSLKGTKTTVGNTTLTATPSNNVNKSRTTAASSSDVNVYSTKSHPSNKSTSTTVATSISHRNHSHSHHSRHSTGNVNGNTKDMVTKPTNVHSHAHIHNNSSSSNIDNKDSNKDSSSNSTTNDHTNNSNSNISNHHSHSTPHLHNHGSAVTNVSNSSDTVTTNTRGNDNSHDSSNSSANNNNNTKETTIVTQAIEDEDEDDEDDNERMDIDKDDKRTYTATTTATTSTLSTGTSNTDNDTKFSSSLDEDNHINNTYVSSVPKDSSVVIADKSSNITNPPPDSSSFVPASSSDGNNSNYYNIDEEYQYDDLSYDENNDSIFPPPMLDLTALQPGQAHAPNCTTLLPPKDVTRFGNRKCLVLDLDETLVHSSFKYLRTADFVIPVEIDGQVHNVYVIKRPGVDKFLEVVGQLYEVVVFTASVSRYGDPLLDILDNKPQNSKDGHYTGKQNVHYRLFRDSCYNYEGNYVKNLSQLGRPLSDIIILDNSPASYIFHPQHAVPISSWFSDSHDNELLDILPILNDLSGVPDVSKILDVTI
ncbi:uncharacterized protein SCODWIG_00392 [Saccharomycodes ludwigii]|uniref:FCP1 homology domain-containing protein n=1 Tax=Saccharomycodes ludwigii TaxID=36035 RepID=A0A376B1U8_9ASCO|nr:hypothetical protein SCDLUD_004791 [Saccharomycodes ludwigii]KAH3899351.1 hypothetical protein SCDLUD_004791 [Saccharomycodes ludwigii]SSD58631.1 uncharacterized protein SCODWIG_00392 [Saccharomycodes ludwigii]